MVGNTNFSSLNHYVPITAENIVCIVKISYSTAYSNPDSGQRCFRQTLLALDDLTSVCPCPMLRIEAAGKSHVQQR